MAPDDHSGGRPAGPVVLRIKLRYDDLDAMVQRFASNVGRSGLFLPTRSIQPIGTEVKFELRLANDVPVLVGLGRVKHVRPPDPDKPKAAFGMGIELMRVSREGREVIIRMIERRRAMGLADVAIPVPEDIEAARRSEVETQPRDTSAVVRDAMAQLAAAPVPEPVLAAPPASGPIAVEKRETRSDTARDSASLLQPPRRDSAPIVSLAEEQSARIPVPVLAPEKSRSRRPRVQEMIDKAVELSGPMIAAISVPELDIHVDLEGVLMRARSLAGGELDVELAALREAAAAPNEINVEAASAELARQLGGKPIAKRERSARWAPPPSVAELRAQTPVVVEEPPAAPEFSAKTRAETEAAPSATIAAVVEAAVQDSAPVAPVEPSPSILPDESYVIRPSTPTYEDSGFHEALAGDDPGDDDAFAANASTTTAVDAVEDPLDAQTERPRRHISEVVTEPSTPALLIDDDADISSFERALDAARIHTGVSKVAPARADDADFQSGPVEMLASGEYQLAALEDAAEGLVERTQIAGVEPRFADGFGTAHPGMSDQLAAQLDQQLAEAERDANRDFAEAANEEEISDLDVLAEADEDDEDLLGASAEADASRGHAAAPEDDFAARLDLGDDDDPPPPSEELDRQAAREFDAALPAQDYVEPARAEYAPQHDYIEPVRAYQPPAADPQRIPRYRRPSSEFPDPPSSSYTFAESFPEAALQLPEQPVGEDFDEPHNYAPEPARPVGPDPRLLRHGRATTAGTEDLEDALAALDVDLDGLSNLGLRRTRRPTPSASSSGVPRALPGLPMESGSRPLPGLPVERPQTGPQRVAHTVPRGSVTGQHATVKPATGPAPIAAKPATPAMAKPKSATRPPPIPAAARKQPTQQVSVVKPPIKRAASEDDGVLIDFDDDE